MSRTKEQLGWDRFRRQCRARGLSLQRIENMVKVGMPDVLSIADSVVTFVENKAAYTLPYGVKIRGKIHPVSIEQMNWHLDWHKNGGLSYILIFVGRTEQFLVEGKYADVVNDMTRATLEAVCIANDWEGIIRCLKTKDHSESAMAALRIQNKGKEK